MKVILKQDISGFGRKYEIKDVSDGYASNYLFPRGLAEMGTAAALAKAKDRAAKADQERNMEEELLKKTLHSLEKVTLTISQNANEEGHLFASVHEKDIAAELLKETRIEVKPEWIVLEKAIKEVGEHKIPVQHGNAGGHFTLVIKAA